MPTFQSTLPHGSDGVTNPDARLQRPISIHAPSRERQSYWWYFYLSIISIHAPSRERPITLLILRFIISVFQSTLPHGSDALPNLLLSRALKFQSTLPHGSDPQKGPAVDLPLDFNPRSLTGATIIYHKITRCIEFQSTLPHGSDS